MTLRFVGPLLPLIGGLAMIFIAGCDSGVSGDYLENRPPTTQLSVRDTSLVDNLCTETPEGMICSGDDDLFTSTLYVAWSGTDPDGFVVGYDLRYYDYAETRGPEEGWTFTTSRDTLILLPIPAGQETAKVVFEVRAIDNDGAKDPNPARTVFPIINSPPTLRLLSTELPPDTTWGVVSFAWEADDPDGPEDVEAIEVRLNDADEFVTLPASVSFITLVADDVTEGTTVTDARVYFGRSVVATDVTLPGLRLDSENTIHVRAVDRSGATSDPVLYPDPDQLQTWYLRRPTSNVLLVNDFRSTRADQAMPFHEAVLEGYLPTGTSFDVWDLSQPVSGMQRSPALPPVGSTLSETLQQWDYIYWVANNITSNVQGSNLAYSATFLEEFMIGGGRLFVQVPLTLPIGGEVEPNNPAFELLPMESVVLRQGSSVPPNLSIPTGGLVEPVENVPGTGRTLPVLAAERIALTLPFSMNFATTVPLYRAEFTDRDEGGQWEGDSFVASMDSERRMALLALNLYSRNRLDFAGEDGVEEKPCLAVQYILEGLTFPGSPGSCPTP